VRKAEKKMQSMEPNDEIMLLDSLCRARHPGVVSRGESYKL